MVSKWIEKYDRIRKIKYLIFILKKSLKKPVFKEITSKGTQKAQLVHIWSTSALIFQPYFRPNEFSAYKFFGISEISAL